MGCFSFMCKECGRAILSNSFSGQMTKLFLLKDGKIIQRMEGEYDSYGRVFNEDRSDSIKWNDPKNDSNDEWDAWSNVCDLLFMDSELNGIAAIHSKCYSKEPTARSEDDPNQGWGDEGEYMTSIDDDEVYE